MTLTIPDKLEALDTALNIDLVERPREIHTALLAVISRCHHHQVGPPGTGKSLLVRALCSRIDGLDYPVVEILPELKKTQDPITGMWVASYELVESTRMAKGYFQWLLTRYSTPEEIFGPPSLTALEHDRYERKVADKLPEARVAFLDEIFRANSSILNALLTITNERLFFNPGHDDRVPLSSLFTAANTEPEGDELNALWDRLHFRHEIKRTQDGGNFVRMLQTVRDPDPEKLITWDEIVRAQKEVALVKLPSDIFDAFKTLRDNLAKEGVEPSERRFADSLRIVQAEAYMNARDVADIDDLRPLQHVLWSEMKDQRIVTRVVLELANPIDKEAHDLLERVQGLGRDLKKIIAEGDNPKQIAKQAVEVHAKLHKAKQRMNELKVRVEESGRKSDVLTEVNKVFIDVAKELMTSGFGVSSDEVKI